MADNEPSGADLRAVILRLVAQRGPDRSMCPSEAARALAGDGWRDVMESVREAARGLAREGVVEISQRGVVLDPDTAWAGPIRIRGRQA